MKNIYEKSESTVFTHECENERYAYSLLTFACTTHTRYGVCIRLSLGQDSYENESADLFSSYEGAIRFLAFLYAHRVTPENLPDVIEDFLSDFDQKG